MVMGPGLRKLALSVHLTVSVGWIGTVVAYLALGVAAATSQDGVTVRTAWIAMDLTGWYVIVPLAIAALLTGIVMALGTSWGLLRHYWVLFSLVLTIVATVVLVLHMPDVSATATIARRTDRAVLHANPQLADGDLVHPGLGLLLLLTIQVLNIFKPRGMTPYGQRKQREERPRAAQHARAG
jgi:hypothetical protein